MPCAAPTPPTQKIAFAIGFGCLAILSHSNGTASALTFDFTPAVDTPLEAVSALEAAGQLLSDKYIDEVTLDIGFRFSSSQAAGAASTLLEYPYSLVRDAMAQDITSSADRSAVANLQAGPGVDMLMNLTSDHPQVPGGRSSYLDNNDSSNNSVIRMTASNAKALGLDRADAIAESIFAGGDRSRDAVVILNPDPPQPWDFDRTDGIALGHTDFIGIVAHELAHVTGFSSGVDILDRSPRVRPEDDYTWVNTLDLFRFSDDSFAAGPGIIDWSSSKSDKYFSLDGGQSVVAHFSTGIEHGDGFFPGHWKSVGTGIMDPLRSPFIGQAAEFSAADLTAIDVIGWDLRTVPEPAGGWLAVVAAVVVTRRKHEHR